MTVSFSHPILFHTPNDVSNWFIRVSGLSKTITMVGISLGAVLVSFGAGPPNPGPDVISYSPPPFDLASDTARNIPAPAFADFPLT